MPAAATPGTVDRTQSSSEAESLVPPKDEESAAAGGNQAKPGKPTPLIYTVGSFVAVCVLLFVVLLFQGRGDLISLSFLREDPAPCDTVKSCGPVIRVFIAWLVLYFAFLFFQSFQKFYVHKKITDGGKEVAFSSVKYGTSGGRETLIGDRTVGNMMEQSVPFLATLALHAVLVDAASAAQLGWLWLLFRAIYPFAFAKGIPMLFLSTLPDYLFILLLALPLIPDNGCDPLCEHGECEENICVCDHLVGDRLFPAPWTGPACDVMPVSLAAGEECCSTWCPAQGHEAESAACEVGFGCCDWTGCCGTEGCSYFSCAQGHSDCAGSC